MPSQPARSSCCAVPASNFVTSASATKLSFSAGRPATSSRRANSSPRCGPNTLYGLITAKSTPQARTSGRWWGALCTASTRVHAPTSRAARAVSATGVSVPVEFAATHSATNLVLSESSPRRSSTCRVPSGQRARQTRTRTPCRSSERHGEWFASCSSSETITSSPSPHRRAKARESCHFSAVALGPIATSSGRAFR